MTYNTDGEMLGASVMRLIPAQKLDEEKLILEKIKRGEIVDHLETVRQKKDGQLMDVSVTMSPIKDVAGKIVGISKVGRDITDRKRNEKALLTSEEQLRTVLDTLEEGVIFSDEGGHFYIYNAAMEQLTGYSREDADKSGNFMKLLFPGPQEYERAAKQLEALINDNRSQELETAIQRKDGQSKDILVYSVIIPYENRKMFLTTFRDITVRKQAEDILKRDKNAIENLVREQASQLIAANLELERGKRLSDIGVLAATVAHELRNPLAAISLAISNMKRKNKDGSLTNHLDVILKKVYESDQIINNLLFYSRLKPSHFEDIAVFDILEECINHTRGGIKKVSVIKDIEPIKTIHIKADAFQLKEVFQNVLNNALDAVSDQTGEIKVSADKDNDFIRVIIKDNGIGMDKACAAKAFEPFFTTKAKGTGLGLSVCKQIIQMHSGSIDVESAPGKGTNFVIRLPVRGGSSGS